MSEVTIKAVYDCLITKAARDEEGKIIGTEPTTKHYTFRGEKNEVVGGFYVKDAIEVPETITLKLGKRGS